MLNQENVSRIILAVVVFLAGFVTVMVKWKKWKKGDNYISDWNGFTSEIGPTYKGISLGGTRIIRKKKTKQKNKK
jgi:hypothetical protein